MAEQIRPNHYDADGKYECIKVMEYVFGKAAVYYFCVLNVFKYVFRHRKKNGINDLKKAQWYLAKAIETYESEDAKIEWGDSLD